MECVTVAYYAKLAESFIWMLNGVESTAGLVPNTQLTTTSFELKGPSSVATNNSMLLFTEKYVSEGTGVPSIFRLHYSVGQEP